MTAPSWLKRRRLLRALGGRDERARWEAAKELSAFNDEVTRRRLERLLGGRRSERARAAAAYVLGFLGDAEAANALAARLADQDESTEVRAYAAEALGHLLQGAPVLAEIRTAIAAGLRDPEPGVRFWCAFAAGVLGLREARPQLTRMAGADDAGVEGWWTVGEEAEWALRVLAGEEDPPLPRDRNPEPAMP
ncbi:MAG TPA: HEAT repeat domain-containing protein [Gaiellaceae bacterium]|nr:HEAT repeat domain-containing protein [Gaiellaceae bacterium]